MSASRHSISQSNVADEAACWFLRLEQSPATAETFLEWQQWLSAAPEHRTAYEQIEETVLRLGRILTTPALPAVDELDRDAYEGLQPVSEWRNETRARSEAEAADIPLGSWRHWIKKNRSWQRVAIAAMALGFVAGAAWICTRQQYADRLGVSRSVYTYRTSAGERRVVRLPEGSRVTLDANSLLTMRLATTERALTLERGEAFFEVASDPERPFSVRAGGARVTALGTAFNVRISGDRTVVAVTEGKVELIADGPSTPKLIERRAAPAPAANVTPRLSAQVDAGEGVSYVDNGYLQTLSTREAPLATGWLSGRRQYRNEPLRYVIEDVDRYTGQSIRIADEATGDLRFTGTLRLENSEAWLRGLSVALPVTVIRQADGELQIAPK
jgi:transmembrane sensor